MRYSASTRGFSGVYTHWTALKVSGSILQHLEVAVCLINPRRACAARVTVLSLCVRACVSECVCYLANSTPLMYRYKVRYESKANVVLKVFDSLISLKIRCSKDTALSTNFDGFDGK